jgi:hypothetical protein
MEASAEGWLNLYRDESGALQMDVFGFSESAYKVQCADCGATDHDALSHEVGAMIYGVEGAEPFRG